MLWAEWWVWAALALVLAILEIVVPAYIFLGFGLGAGVIGAMLLVGGPVADYLSSSWQMLLVAFAVVSVIGWVALRRFLGVTRTQVKTFEDDINEG